MTQLTVTNGSLRQERLGEEAHGGLYCKTFYNCN